MQEQSVIKGNEFGRELGNELGYYKTIMDVIDGQNVFTSEKMEKKFHELKEKITEAMTKINYEDCYGDTFEGDVQSIKNLFKKAMICLKLPTKAQNTKNDLEF